jgi:3-phosphoshikimate 1-carboxyvinyltransferase
MASAQSVIVQPAPRVAGRVRPPGDKSISHRYAMLAAIAEGTSTIDV